MPLYSNIYSIKIEEHTMQSIEEKAIDTYNKNMQYFKQKHEKLYNKLSALNIVLNDGTYPQKYELEYKDDYFDVLEIASGNFLYTQNSKTYGDKLYKEINMRKDQQVCETFYNFDFTPDALKKANKSDALHNHATTAPIIAYYNKYVDAHTHFIRIYKFIFFGLGLATHVEKIIKRIKPESILLVEDDLELFRLSLFTCNYADALKDTHALFAIAQNDEDLSIAFRVLYERNMFSNHYLKFSLFSTAYESKVKLLQEYIVARPEKCYSHERILHKNQRVLQRIGENFRFLNLQKKELPTFFQDKPVLILAAGPSLNKNIEWLKENHQNFITITIFAALKTLQKHHISPNIIVQLDEKVNEGVTLVRSFENFDFLKDSIFLLSPSVPDIFFNTFNHNNIFLIEDRSYYKQKELQINAASVGEVAYSLPLVFNAKEIYLLGLDLALADDGSTHSKEHHATQKAHIEQKNSTPDVTNLILSTFEIKGNFKQSVITTPLLALSIPKVNGYTQKLKSSTQNVYNLSDGAYFKETIPLHIQNIKAMEPLDPHTISKKIHQLFEQYSSTSLTQEEIMKIQNRKKELESIREHLNNFKLAPTINVDLFRGAYLIFIHNIMMSEKNELRELLLVYIYNTSNYIIDFFNTKELDNTKKHTKNLKKIIITQYNKIIDYYEDILIQNTNI